MNDETVVNESEFSTDASLQEEISIVDQLEQAKAETAELHEKYLRLAAEMENFRRRTERERKDIRAYAITTFARDMLTVSDNLSRALDSIPVDKKETSDTSLKALIEGVEMTKRSMLSALESHGVCKTEAQGQKFDPNFHQAMFEEHNEAVPNNTVIKVVQEGYNIGDRVLRPAMVGVAKGGPKLSQLEKNSPNYVENEHISSSPETEIP
ncbi:Heat shock protein GrpE [Liberibacter crescens BT-1]|uniref:Protein GrpE n=1 Tax=Liberibacter crescens (strain BT-1) TaxID=1215343 RepID=L0EXZ2_LIBCB|nr:nucleotide exchange factor GrpE [Liberibacter crescens]AGA65251.1 Heat shock protein GrpE [Liberibacter crescens BT-1]